MRDFLMLKLQGCMQAWGEHTFEGLRPSANFPGKSSILGLLGACLGIRRNEYDQLEALANSVSMAVRVDKQRSFSVVKMTDYHTVKDARKEYSGLGSHETIQTWREYLYDAEFTVALWSNEAAEISLDEIEKYLKKPVFTPYLGRRSCPLNQPMFYKRVDALGVLEAFNVVEPEGGTIYSEERVNDSEEQSNVRMKRVRDIPLIRQPRQFGSRNIYVYGGKHVFE